MDKNNNNVVFERNGRYSFTTMEVWKSFGYGDVEKMIAKNLSTVEANKLIRLLSNKDKLIKLAIKSVRKRKDNEQQ